MLDTSVRYYDSTMTGAPTLSGQSGALIGVLNACLDVGIGGVTLTGLTVSDGVATATKAGHGFTALIDGTIAVYPVIRISGADPAELNGDWRLNSIPDANTFTFDATGVADGSATGTITAVRAPAWSTPTDSCVAYSGTSKSAYQRVHPSASAMLLRVDDAPAQYPSLVMYEAMTDVDTGIGPAPTSGSHFFGKSSVANATAREWRLIADPLSFYLFGKADGSTWHAAMDFGDIDSYKAGDAYPALLHAHASATYINSYASINSWGLLARSYPQTGGAIIAQAYSHGRGAQLGNLAQAYPAPADNAFHAWPVEVWEGNTLARGLMPGLWNPVHNTSGPSDGQLVAEIPRLPNAVLLVQRLFNSAVAIDLIGPWR